MKAVMISIQPKWAIHIINGEKTIAVFKTAPKLETSFKCYIYCTKAKDDYHILELHDWGTGKFTRLDGKVFGEFICDKIFNTDDWIYSDEIAHIFTEKNMCLSYKELAEYLNGKVGYCWHISDLKIYDKPKEISEFYVLCDKTPTEITCRACSNNDGKSEFCFNKRKPLTRPPESWKYIEEIGE